MTDTDKLVATWLSLAHSRHAWHVGAVVHRYNELNGRSKSAVAPTRVSYVHPSTKFRNHPHGCYRSQRHGLFRCGEQHAARFLCE